MTKERNEEMKQEKFDMLLDLLEHPDNYSESQKDELLGDKEVKEFYQQMVEAREALDYQKSKEEIMMPSVSDEWEKFRSEKRSVKSEESNSASVNDTHILSTDTAKVVSLWSPMQKVAAIAAVLIFSGITFAAIHLVTQGNHSASSQTEQTIVRKDSVQASTVIGSKNQEEKKDTMVTTKLPLLYENVELQGILTPIAEHFHVSVSYQNESARHIRLYLQLSENMGLDEIIELMNHFEKVNIRHEGKSLIVE